MNRHTGSIKKRSVKNQIRGIERLLRQAEKKNLPKQKIAEMEGRLKSLRKKKIHLKTCEKEKKHVLRYKKIMFIEKKKILRMIKKARRQNKSSAVIASLEADLQYIVHFPKTEKYISLFVKSDDAEKLARSNKKLKELREIAATNAKSAIQHEENADGFVKKKKTKKGKRERAEARAAMAMTTNTINIRR